MLAAVAGSMVTRTASKIAFSKQGRGERVSMYFRIAGVPSSLLFLFIGVVTQDMLPEIGSAFAEIFGREGEKGWGSSESGGKL